MAKDPLFTGQPIFNQLLSILDRAEIQQLARQFQSDRYYKRFRTFEHLVTMLYATFHKCTSLREVTTGMQACAARLHHLGIGYCPRRSTLSDANSDRSAAVFEAIYYGLHKAIRHRLPDSRQKTAWLHRLFIIDSTTVSLFKEILKNAGKLSNAPRITLNSYPSKVNICTPSAASCGHVLTSNLPSESSQASLKHTEGYVLKSLYSSVTNVTPVSMSP